jgi:uncharacterized membrane protein required for colicin V production
MTGTIAWLGSGFLATITTPLFTPLMIKYFTDEELASTVAATLAYLVMLITMLLLSGLISEKIKQSPFADMDKSFGLLAGLIRGVTIPLAVSSALYAFNIPNDKFEIIANSRISCAFSNVIDKLKIDDRKNNKKRDNKKRSAKESAGAGQKKRGATASIKHSAPTTRSHIISRETKEAIGQSIIPKVITKQRETTAKTTLSKRAPQKRTKRLHNN